MARSQMLYIGDKGAVSYPAAGNIEINDGSAGTVALWYHPMGTNQRCDVFRANVDGYNHLQLSRSQRDWNWRSRSGGNASTVTVTSDPVAWRFVVATWDFTGGPGAGVLRLYLDGEEVQGSPLTTASAPAGTATTIEIGPGEGNTYTVAHAAYDQFAIWNEALSPQDIAALHGRGRRHTPQESDGIGTLLLRASWDEQFDADIAEGSGAATLRGAADQLCRLDTRSRHQGKRMKYRIGLPAHDGSDDDSVPLHALLTPVPDGTIAVTNHEGYGELGVDAGGELHPAGVELAPWLPQPTNPVTLRVGLHVDSIDVPNGEPVAVGAQNYVTGKIADFQASAGCTASTLVSSTLTQPDGYWAGAELHVLTGGSRGQKVRVVDNSQATTSITIDGQFGQAPEVGDRFTVVEPWRVEPPHSDGHMFRLECDLEERHDGIDRWSVLETTVIGTGGYSRYNCGRIQYYPVALTDGNIFFGKREDGVTHDQWTCTIFIERLEMDGPMTYEITRNPDDSFMVVDPASGESVKVIRAENVLRETRQPEQHPDPSAVQAAMVNAGTWRDSVASCPRSMAYDAENDRLVAVLVGVDPDGVQRAGYIHGTWNDASGLVEWADDPDPRNPFLALDDLRAVLGGKSSIVGGLAAVGNAYKVDEGNWALQFTATIGNPDGVLTCAMEGAPDRYSFDPKLHFDRTTNPLTPTLSGDDKVVSEGSGIGLFGNRDCEILFVENPWAKRSGDRFWGCGRAKTMNHYGAQANYQPGRPLTCAVTGDFRNVRHVPWPNQVVAAAHGQFHWAHPQWYYPSAVGVLVDDGMASTSDVGLWVAEDQVHFRRVMSLIPRNTPPYDASRMMPLSSAPRLGARRIYWYRAGYERSEFNIATIRLGGEALYRLADGAVAGELETSTLLRTGDRWQDLRLNSDPKGGGLTVAVLEAETGVPVPGYGHGDCDGIANEVEGRVTWNGVGLGEVADDRVRLEFRLTRSGTGAASPELYEWMIGDLLSGEAPEVAAVRVEGAINPASVANPQPEFAWSYSDSRGLTQSGYQVLVASTQAKLDAGEGDIWDSGVVLSEEPKAKYAGEQLASLQTYFWKVRVRNSEGVWSEEW